MKLLGKIEKVRYGAGGYQEAMFGLTVTLSLDGGQMGVCDFKGQWTTYPEGAKYTEMDWAQGHLNATLFVIDLLKQAKKDDVAKLVGTPVEAEVEGNTLKSWRVLTEVL